MYEPLLMSRRHITVRSALACSVKAELYEERDEEENHHKNNSSSFISRSSSQDKLNNQLVARPSAASDLESSPNAKMLMDDDTKILYNFLVKCRLPQTKQIIKKYENLLMFRHALVKECLKWGICFRRQMSFRSKDEFAKLDKIK